MPGLKYFVIAHPRTFKIAHILPPESDFGSMIRNSILGTSLLPEELGMDLVLSPKKEVLKKWHV